MQLLKNLFEVCWKWKNADIICYKLTSLVSLWQRNVKKIQKLMKIASIDRESVHTFWVTWGISMKFSWKMWYHKKQGFYYNFRSGKTIRGFQISP